MRSKIPLSLLLSLAFHVVLILGLFSGSRRGGKGEAIVVELVSFSPAEPAVPPGGDVAGSSDLIPPRPAFPVQSGETLASSEEDLPPPPGPASVEENEGPASSPPPSDREEQEAALSAEPDAPFDPDLLSMDDTEDIEESLAEEEVKPEPAFRLVAGGARSGNGSSGAGGGGEKESGGRAPQPTVGDALPGGTGIGGAGGGRGGPRFVIPSAGRSNPKPRYPESARAEGREGTTLLRVTVLPSGRVGEALIERSSGHADLDRSAVEAVMKWTFLPARRGKNLVTSSVRIPVTFLIDR